MIYHGIWVPIRNACGYWDPPPWSDAEYQRLRNWGLNAVNYIATWDYHLELDENSPRVYESKVMDELDNQVKLALEVGLQPFIDITAQTGSGWVGLKGGDYIVYNQQDSSGSYGQDRYIALLQYLAERYPKLGIDVWLFPYHAESDKFPENPEINERLIRLHSETLPNLYDSIKTFTKAPIVINPIWQGQWGTWETGNACEIYDLVEQFGWPFARDSRLYLGFSNKGKKSNALVSQGAEWNYDYERIDQHIQPLLNFKQRHLESVGGYICSESIALRIHNTNYPEAAIRPVKQSRLDWAKYIFEKMKNNDLGWSHFDLGWWISDMSHGPMGDYSILEADGSDSAVSMLMSEYAPTPKFPLWNFFGSVVKYLGPIGLGLYLIGRMPKRRG